MASAWAISSSARAVRRPGSPGPAPTRWMMPTDMSGRLFRAGCLGGLEDVPRPGRQQPLGHLAPGVRGGARVALGGVADPGTAIRRADECLHAQGAVALVGVCADGRVAGGV